MKESTMAKGLGWFSIGLGVAQLVAPKQLGRMIGVGRQPVLMRALGVREVMAGVGILAPGRLAPGLWARVAGDAMDMALLARAFAVRRRTRNRIAGAAGMVLGIGVLDYLAARRTS